MCGWLEDEVTVSLEFTGPLPERKIEIKEAVSSVSRYVPLRL